MKLTEKHIELLSNMLGLDSLHRLPWRNHLHAKEGDGGLPLLNELLTHGYVTVRDAAGSSGYAFSATLKGMEELFPTIAQSAPRVIPVVQRAIDAQERAVAEMFEDAYLAMSQVYPTVLTAANRDFLSGLVKKDFKLQGYPEQDYSRLRDAVESCARALVSEQQRAVARWHVAINKQGWNDESKIAVLEGFLAERGLMVDFAAYAEQRAQSENDPANAGYIYTDGWDHIFVGDRGQQTRWVMDVAKEEVIFAQVKQSLGWVDLTAGERKDLQESLVDANDLPAKYLDFDIEAGADLPEWATKHEERPRARG